MGDGRQLSVEEVQDRAGAGPEAELWQVLLAVQGLCPCTLCGESTRAGVVLPTPSGSLRAWPVCRQCRAVLRAALEEGDSGR